MEQVINKARSQELKNEGNNFFKNGDFEQALTYYNKAIEQNPQDVLLYSNKALCHLKLCQYEKGLEACLEAKNIDASLSKIYHREGLIYLGMGNLLYSSKSFIACINFQKTQQDKDALKKEFISEIIKEVQSRDQASARDLEKLESIQDKEASQEIKKQAMTFYKQTDYDQAAELFIKAIELDYKNTDLYNQLALIYQKLHLNNQALKIFQQARQIDPKNFKLLEKEAKIHLSCGNPFNAALTYIKALEIQPENEWVKEQILRKDVMNQIKKDPFLEEIWISMQNNKSN